MAIGHRFILFQLLQPKIQAFSRCASSYLSDPDEMSWSFVGASPGFVSENLRLSAVVVTCWESKKEEQNLPSLPRHNSGKKKKGKLGLKDSFIFLILILPWFIRQYNSEAVRKSSSKASAMSDFVGWQKAARWQAECARRSVASPVPVPGSKLCFMGGGNNILKLWCWNSTFFILFFYWCIPKRNST